MFKMEPKFVTFAYLIVIVIVMAVVCSQSQTTVSLRIYYIYEIISVIMILYIHFVHMGIILRHSTCFGIIACVLDNLRYKLNFDSSTRRMKPIN